MHVREWFARFLGQGVMWCICLPTQTCMCVRTPLFVVAGLFKWTKMVNMNGCRSLLFPWRYAKTAMDSLRIDAHLIQPCQTLSCPKPPIRKISLRPSTCRSGHASYVDSGSDLRPQARRKHSSRHHPQSTPTNHCKTNAQQPQWLPSCIHPRNIFCSLTWPSVAWHRSPSETVMCVE